MTNPQNAPSTKKTILRSEFDALKEETHAKLSEEAAKNAANKDKLMVTDVRKAVGSNIYVDTRTGLPPPKTSGGSSSASRVRGRANKRFR